MRVAREWQVPHSTLMRDWSSKDIALAIAHLVNRDDIGPCGQPHSVTTAPGNEERYEVRDDLTCAACARLEQHRRHNEDDMPPGVILRVVDVSGPDLEETAFGPEFD